MDKPSSPTSHRVEEPIVEEEVPGPLSPPKPLSSRAKPEDLVARAIAPVNAEYLRPLPSRSCPNSEEKRNEGNGVSEKSEKKVFVKDKKSKRQLKRERQQERKSAQHICPVVAKTGNQNACQYGSNCRFSHDVDAFLAQKPADLEGTCPFLTVEESCPYGIGCRYFSTHKELVAASEISIVPKNSIEVNALKKDLQKLLWKNKFSFSKADTQLRLLGLLGGDNSKAEDKQVDAHSAIMQGLDTLRENNDTEMVGNLIDKVPCNPSLCTEKDCLDDASTIEDLGPPKKAKNSADENGCPTDTNSGTCHVEIEYEEPCALKEFHDTPTDISHASKVELCPEINAREKKLIDFRGKLYLAPLTTVGNLPFRRVCKGLGADITCGEMAMCTNLLQGQASEWALLRRHSSEDVFGVQICGAYPDTIARAVELIGHECNVDFIDINMGCPIDIVVNKGAGSSLLTKPMRMKNIIKSACGTVNKPITVKVRTGYFEGRNRIDSLIADISQWGATALTIHGRSRQQRYSKLADWDYIYQCAQKAPERLQVLGNGDISSYLDWNKHTCECPQLSSCMIARGALIKPWIFTEIKEQRHWDITSGERFQILEDFARFGLQHWGSDHKGVETTRHFLLEWLSYTYRYIPVGLLDVIPQRLNWRPPSYFGRNDLETLMASDSAADWIRISEMLLGNVPDGFSFAPKHKSNAYDTAENG